MPYSENVQKACDELGIENPIQENDLLVKAVSFLVDGEWIRIEGTDMNRAGRLFFHYFFRKIGTGDLSHVSVENTVIAKSLVRISDLHYVCFFNARDFFAENWEDAKTVGRKMLIALMDSEAITIHWKRPVRLNSL